MVDKFTNNGIRRKRPEPDEPVAKAARAERQVRLRLPTRVRVELDADHGDEGPLKAEERAVEEDSLREKNARLRDTATGRYTKRRDDVLESWAAKAEKREARYEIIAARQAREAERKARLNGKVHPDLERVAHGVAADSLVAHVATIEERKSRQRPGPPKSLVAQIEEGDGIDSMLPPHLRARIKEPIKKGRG